MATFKAHINRFLLGPPLWVRILGPMSIVLLVLGMASKRGWLVSIIAAIVYGLMAATVAVSPRKLFTWSKGHPVFDGAIAGPLFFLAAAYLTSWPIWVCLLIGLAGVLLGAGAGLRRSRFQGITRSSVSP